MENTIGYLEILIRETRKPESEVMTKAFQIGLRNHGGNTFWHVTCVMKFLGARPLNLWGLLG